MYLLFVYLFIHLSVSNNRCIYLLFIYLSKTLNSLKKKTSRPPTAESGSSMQDEPCMCVCVCDSEKVSALIHLFHKVTIQRTFQNTYILYRGLLRTHMYLKTSIHAVSKWPSKGNAHLYFTLTSNRNAHLYTYSKVTLYRGLLRTHIHLKTSIHTVSKRPSN